MPCNRSRVVSEVVSDAEKPAAAPAHQQILPLLMRSAEPFWPHRAHPPGSLPTLHYWVLHLQAHLRAPESGLSVGASPRQVRAACCHPVFERMRARVAAVLDEDAHSARSASVSRTQQCFAVGAPSYAGWAVMLSFGLAYVHHCSASAAAAVLPQPALCSTEGPC